MSCVRVQNLHSVSEEVEKYCSNGGIPFVVDRQEKMFTASDGN